MMYWRINKNNILLPTTFHKNLNIRHFNRLCILHKHRLQSYKIIADSGDIPSCVSKASNVKCFCPSIRLQSTSTVNADQLLKIPFKKKRFKNKNFAELLEVNVDSYLQTKASVQKLKSIKLTEFIKKATPLGELPTTASSETNNTGSNYKHTFYEPPMLFLKESNYKQIHSNQEHMQTIQESLITFMKLEAADVDSGLPTNIGKQSDMSGVSYNREYPQSIYNDNNNNLIQEIEIENTPNLSKIQLPKKNLQFVKSKNLKALELERSAKQQSLTVTLAAYLDMCVEKGMTNRGLAVLLHYRFKYQKLNIKLDNIELYNILMNGYAEKGNLHKIKEIFAILKQDGIPLSPQTYGILFECMGRLPENQENMQLLSFYANDANTSGYSLNDIIDKGNFILDQQDMVLLAIRRLQKNFTPIYSPPYFIYSNNLLNHLNENVKAIDFKTHHTTDNQVTADPSGNEIMTAKRGFTAADYEKFLNDQISLEIKGCITIKNIHKFNESNHFVEEHRKKLEELRAKWFNDIVYAFNRDFCSLRSHTQLRTNLSINLLPYLKALPVEQYADIILNEVRHLAEGSEMFSLSVGQLYRNLGQKVFEKYELEYKKRKGILDKMVTIYKLYCDTLSDGNSTDNSRQCYQRYIHEHRDVGSSMNVSSRTWPASIKISVGRFLYQILLRDLKLDVNLPSTKVMKCEKNLPAFYTLFRNQGKLIKEDVKPHPILVKLYRGAQLDTLTFDANMVPMLSPPQPWHTPTHGGYLLATSELLRLPSHAHQQLVRINDMHKFDIYPSLDSLNQLSSIPWRVNTNVLDVILKVFNDGGSKKLNVPESPSSLPQPKFPNKIDFEKCSKQERFQMLKNKMNHKRQQSEMYSLWCDTLYRLSLANHYRDRVFWLPHNMDFRGRVYPIPPHLNHLGSDLARSLLVFHQTQPLGKNGLNWLKLHCINLTGFKKREPLDSRLNYANSIIDDILDSAERPLDGRQWWATSDEPWQTLACCMEIAKVLQSDNHETYMTGFPVHQDGSCNGLQHYAALGRDRFGAQSVNLAPLESPQDVYSDVAALVEIQRKTDASNDLQIAKILDGFVKRKVIKQTVMTTVYGVTRYGARLQIARQLKDIDAFPKEWVWPASLYLTTKTFDSLREMFQSTKEIQDWLTDCARLISAVCGQHVEWTTPLGLPIVQPYNRAEKNVLPKSNRIQENYTVDVFERPNVLKQKNAFPPNFIHSLDSSHMMLTGLNCEKNGLTFISVHDCFWTHPNTVSEMNNICREQFVALHSQSILEHLSTFLTEKYSYNEKDLTNNGTVLESTRRKLNKLLLQIPPKGDFDLAEILKSTYFFS